MLSSFNDLYSKYIPSLSVIVTVKSLAPLAVTADSGVKLSIVTVKLWSPSSITSSLVGIVTHSERGKGVSAVNTTWYGPAV